MRTHIARFDTFGALARRVPMWAPVALTLLLTACASVPSTGNNPFGGAGGAESGGSVRIYVQNLGFSNVQVYAVTAGRSRDLGTVQTSQTRIFHLPLNGSATLSFRLDFQTSSPYTTRTVGVSAGQTVEVDIPANGGYATVQVQ